MPNLPKKKGESGHAISYITRTQAIKRLQITLKDFRRLCILKGIFPRTPKRKVHGANKTYYLTKDIRYLQHEPLLNKFRELKTFLKRHSRALNRREDGLAENLRLQKPIITLDHIVKERYPSFDQALSEMDDVLTMIYLFAAIPSDYGIPPERIARCKQLVQDWEEYVVRTKCLVSAFLSIKGVYMQVVINGQSITWIAPYPFPQQMPKDIDYRVMDTFVQFYDILLAFVLYKLKHDAKMLPTTSEEVDSEDEQDAEFKGQNDVVSDRFSLTNQTVFLGREVPRSIFSFLIKALGGNVAWDDVDSPVPRHDDVITIEICDRPKPLVQVAGREYVQPQWIVDCLNFKKELPMIQYRPGTELPPHLSPFVDNEKEGYVPQRLMEVEEMNVEGDEEEDVEEGNEDDESSEDEGEETGVGLKRRLSDKEIERAKLMMTKKKRREYEFLDREQKKKEANVDKLKKKAKQLRMTKRVRQSEMDF
ncbi:hypothetical protein RCL1_002771 [Eukaryota sp. TZLM3-RCL]